MRLLVWDFDGTLAHRPGLWSGAARAALERHAPDHGLTEDDLRAFLRTGFPWDEPEITYEPARSPEAWWSDLAPLLVNAYLRNGIPPSLAKRAAADVREVYLDLQSWKLFDDTIPALASLQSAGWTHAMLSNHVPELEGIVAGLGLAPFFGSIFSSALTGFEKPNPKAFKHVLAHYPGVERAVMIGDNAAADIRGARAAGLPAMLVRRFDPEFETVADLRELRSLLEP